MGPGCLPPSPRHGTWLPTPSPWTWDLRTYTPSPLLLTSGGHHWRPVQTCSLKDLPHSTHQYWHLSVATETCTVGKRVVRILLPVLEYCLVITTASSKISTCSSRQITRKSTYPEEKFTHNEQIDVFDLSDLSMVSWALNERDISSKIAVYDLQCMLHNLH